MRSFVSIILVVLAAAGCMRIQALAGKKVWAIEGLPRPSGENACNLEPGTDRYTTTVHLRYYIPATEQGHVIDSSGQIRAAEHATKVEVPEEVLTEALALGAEQLAGCTGGDAKAIEADAEVIGHRIEGVRKTNTVKTKYVSTTDPEMLFYEVTVGVEVGWDGRSERTMSRLPGSDVPTYIPYCKGG